MTKTVKEVSDKVTIKIPRPLYNKISDVIEDAGYNSVTDFVVYVLRDLVVSHELAGKKTGNKTSAAEEMEKIKLRLKALGYL